MEFGEAALRGPLPGLRYLVRGARLPSEQGITGLFTHRGAQAHRAQRDGCSPATRGPRSRGAAERRRATSRDREPAARSGHGGGLVADLDQMLARSATFCCARSTTNVSSSALGRGRPARPRSLSRGVRGDARRERFAFDLISDGARRAIATETTVVIDYAQTGLPDRKAVRRRARLPAHARRAHRLSRAPGRAHHRRPARRAPRVHPSRDRSWSKRSPARPAPPSPTPGSTTSRCGAPTLPRRSTTSAT